MHIDDAVEILRMEEQEISEIAMRFKDFGTLHSIYAKLDGATLEGS